MKTTKRNPNKEVSYIHHFIGIRCIYCGGELWTHVAIGPPDAEGFTPVDCFECEKRFKWKKIEILQSV